MRIREARPEDIPGMLRLFVASVHELAAAHYDEAQRTAWAPRESDPERWRKRCEGLVLLVAEEHDALLGFVGFGSDGHVDLLYTAPGHARRGVATRLHREMFERLRAAGVTALHTEASEVARAFFERQGYRVVEREVVRRNGVALPRYRMKRP